MEHQKHPLQPKKVASINIPLKNILNYIFKIFIYLYKKNIQNNYLKDKHNLFDIQHINKNKQFST